MEAFYKLVYDISCYYAFAAFFVSYGMEYDANPLSFLVLFAACFLAVYAEKCNRFSQAVQISAFVLPVIPFLLETNIWGKLILILPWAYLVMTVVRQGYDINYNRFKKTYLCFFWIYIAVFALFVAEDFVKGEVAMMVAGPYMVIFLVSGIFLLQMLRYQTGSGDKKKLEKYQRRQMVIFLVAAVVLTAGNIVELLYAYVIYPISKLVFGAVGGLLVYIVNKLGSAPKPPREFGNSRNFEEYAEQLREAQEKMESIWGPIRERMQAYDPNPKEMDYTPVFIGIAVVAAIVIFAVMLGGKRIKRKQAAIEDAREDFYDEVPVEEVIKKRSLRPEIVIRYYYREFMKKSEAKKHKLEISDTTNEILTKYQAWNDATQEQTAEAEEATVLYQKTRYSKSKVTRTDANRMKALVKGL